MTDFKFKPGDKVQVIPGMEFGAATHGLSTLTARAVSKHGFNCQSQQCGGYDSHNYKNWQLVEPKVTVAQIREFVTNAHTIDVGVYQDPSREQWVKRSDILDFIDNVPKKPTAEEIVAGYLNSAGIITGECWEVPERAAPAGITGALREAGLLKEEA